jgi:tetratricopeptide (TPR) repeat protein
MDAGLEASSLLKFAEASTRMGPMPARVQGNQLRGPYLSLVASLVVIFLLVAVFFVIVYQVKMDRDALAKQNKYRDRLALYTEESREAIDRAYRLLSSGSKDGYHEGLAAPRAVLESLDDMIQRWPDYAEPCLLRGRIDMIFRDLDSAEKFLTRYLDRRPPGHPLGYVDRAILNGLRIVNLALADASNAEIRKLGESAQEDVQLFKTWFEEDLQKQHERDVMRYWNSAVLMGLLQLFHAEYAKAADWFDNWSDPMPDTVTGRSLRLVASLRFFLELDRRVRERAGRPMTPETQHDQQSLEDLRKDLRELAVESVRICPDHPELLSLAGHVYLATGQTEEAIRSFEAARASDAGYLLAQYGLARAHLQKGDAARALESLKGFTIAESAKARPLLTSGVHLTAARSHALRHRTSPNAEDLEAAIQSYRQAISKDPSSIDLHLERARMLIQAMKYDEAESDLSYILSTHPENLETRLERIDVYLATGRRAEALADIDKAEKINAERKLGRDALIEKKKEKAESLPPR